MDEKSYVYFIKKENSDSIKIGKSTNPKKRLSSLNTSSDEKLNCLAIFDEDVVSERDLHIKFNFYRKKNEWFYFSKDIHKYINVEMESKNLIKDFFPEQKEDLKTISEYKELVNEFLEHQKTLEKEIEKLKDINEEIRSGLLPREYRNEIFKSLKEQLQEISIDLDNHKESLVFEDKQIQFMFEKLMAVMWNSIKRNMAGWYYWNIDSTYPVMTIMSMIRNSEKK